MRKVVAKGVKGDVPSILVADKQILKVLANYRRIYLIEEPKNKAANMQ